VGFTTGELAFASPLSGPVTFRQGGDLVVDLTGSGDNRIYVATVEGDRDLEFEVVNDLGHPDQPHALATGYLRGENLAATIQNLPLTDLKLPQGGVDGVGTVSGLITSAEITANLRLPTLRATFDIEDPGLGYLSLPPATVATIADSAALDSPVELVEPVEPDSPLEPDRPAEPDAPVELETRYGRLRGTVTYADSVVSLVGVALESASGKSRYLASGTYTLAKEPQLKGELVVENGQIQDILSVLMIFERADFRANLLKPPEWFRPATEADLASLEEVNPVGDRNASLLDQLRRFAEVLELQDLLAANASESRFPSLEEFTGGLSGKVTARGPLSKDLEVTFDLAGADWVWGDPATTNGSSYRISEVIAQGRYQDSILEINPVSLRSDFSEFSAATQTGVALATLNGEFSFDPADPVERYEPRVDDKRSCARDRSRQGKPDQYRGELDAAYGKVGHRLRTQRSAHHEK
jgi:translocation and assembly module TamB